MAIHIARFSGISIIILWVTGCAGVARLDLVTRTGGNAALFGQFQAYDGHTGRRIPFSKVVHRCRVADVVLFGEQHSDPVCNQLEAQLLYALADKQRPVALAMEFFEVDTQATLDAYLRGRIEESPFRDDTPPRPILHTISPATGRAVPDRSNPGAGCQCAPADWCAPSENQTSTMKPTAPHSIRMNSAGFPFGTNIWADHTKSTSWK